MQRKVLIVDDNKMNRKMLHNILRTQYDVIEAENGEEALSILRTKYKSISAVILDIAMPVMDGFEVLGRMRDNMSLLQIPVIIATGSEDENIEVSALALGANDFVTKPYNPTLILHCLHNTINLRETASIVNALQRDNLTGLYNRETFFEKASIMINEHEPGYYVMACFDVDNFKVVNDQYGAAEGDRILQHIGKVSKVSFDSINGICSRISADNFAALYPYGEKELAFVTEMREQELIPKDTHATIVCSIGRYIVTDITLSVSSIYDRAYMAKQSVKGRYDIHTAYFDESMRDKLIQNQVMISEMDAALAEGNFEIWLQPQFNHPTGALIGAEALVRWRHPQRGLIQPSEFISVFEQNGFIYELDKYVWEQSCRYLRKWIDEGRSPLPIAVNISRYDVFKADLIDVIMGFVHKYDIPVDLLRLEITESAFAESSEQIISVVKQLMDLGFMLEIDDFGSGYSSLNTLKDVLANVIKLDMHFLENNENSQRSGNILQSIVRMAKWLDMAVIAEGVETIEQADFLKSIGCNYVQGYLYAKPMPLAEYEALAKNTGKEQKLLTLKTVENLDNNSFWDPKSMDTLIFNSYVGGACIYEYNNGKIEVLRVNDKYVQVMANTGMTIEDALKLDWAEHLDDKNRTTLLATLQKSIKTGDEVIGELVFLDLPGCPRETYIRFTMRVIASTGDRHLIYCRNENMTAQRQAEQNENKTSVQLQAIMKNINGGVTASVINDGIPTILFANEQFYHQMGYTKEQYDKAVRSPYDLVHPEDRERVAESMRKASEARKSYTDVYRIIRRDKTVIWLQTNVSITSFPDIEEPVLLAVANNITAQKQGEEELREADEQLRFLNDIAHDFLSQTDNDKGIENSLWRLLDYFGGNRVYIFEFDYEKEVINNTYEVCAEKVPIEKENLQNISIDIIPFWLHAFDEQNYINIEDVDALEDSRQERQLLLDQGIKSLIAVPLRRDGILIGFIGIDDSIRQQNSVGRLYAIDDYLTVMLTRRDLNTKIINDNEALQGLMNDTPGSFVRPSVHHDDIVEYRTHIDRLKLLTDNIPGGLVTFEFSPKGLRLIYFNKWFYEFSGYSENEFTEKSNVDPLFWIFKEDLPNVYAAMESIKNGDTQIADCMYRCYTKNNGYKWFSMKSMVSDRHGDSIIINAVQFDITEQKQTEERLRMNEEQFRIAAALGDRMVARFDIKTGTYYNDSSLLFEQGFGKEIKNVPQAFIDAGLIDTESIDNFLQLFGKIKRGAQNATATVALRVPDEGIRWFRIDVTTIFDEGGEPSEAIVVLFDATDQRERETVYQKWQQSLQEKPSDSYTLFRCNLSKNSCFDSVEGSLLQITAGSETVPFNMRTMEYVEKFVYQDDRSAYIATLNSDKLLANYYRGKRAYTLEYREIVSTDIVRWLRLSIELVEYPDSTDIEAYLMYEDIDESKRIELQTKELAETDPLTGVFNRNTFTEKMKTIITERKNNSLHALLMFDIDCFKLVNDNFGHAVGDKALVDISKTLLSILRKGDLIGRLGGDEFLVCLKDMPSRGAIDSKAREICSMVRRSSNMDIQMSVSLGISVCPDDGEEFETLYHKADTALYHVKATGKDNYTFYSDGMHFLLY